jgi:hypothetical protein
MIMGLERLDRITAFMEEQSGPPKRSTGSVGTIPEEAPEGSGAQHSTHSAQSRASGVNGWPHGSAEERGAQPQGNAVEQHFSGMCIAPLHGAQLERCEKCILYMGVC